MDFVNHVYQVALDEFRTAYAKYVWLSPETEIEKRDEQFKRLRHQQARLDLVCDIVVREYIF